MEEKGKSQGDDTLSIAEHNLRFYEQGCDVPKDAIKEIKAGRLKGMSDVNPMWRIRRLTEIFGPCGFGWKYEIDKQWTEAYGNEVKCFCNISLYVRDPETKEWSAAIPGNGGSAIVSVESKGAYVNDEAYKMALTDALSIAMKPLGIGAKVWYGEKANGHNESKYEQQSRSEYSAYKQNAAAMAKEALDQLECCNSQANVTSLWNEWAKKCPEICTQGGEFYNAVAVKLSTLPKS